MPIKIKSKRLNRKSRKMKGGSSSRRSSGKKSGKKSGRSSGSTVTPTIDSNNISVTKLLVIENNKLQGQVANLESKITDIETKITDLEPKITDLEPKITKLTLAQEETPIPLDYYAKQVYRTFRPIILVNEDGTDIDDPVLYYRQFLEPYGSYSSVTSPPLPIKLGMVDSIVNKKITTNIYTMEKVENLVSIKDLEDGASVTRVKGNRHQAYTPDKPWGTLEPEAKRLLSDTLNTGTLDTRTAPQRIKDTFNQIKQSATNTRASSAPISETSIFDIKTINTYKFILNGKAQFRLFHKGTYSDGHDSVWGWVRVE